MAKWTQCTNTNLCKTAISKGVITQIKIEKINFPFFAVVVFFFSDNSIVGNVTYPWTAAQK